MVVARVELRPQEALCLLVHLPVQRLQPGLRERVRLLLVQVDQAPAVLRDSLAIRAQDDQAGNVLHVEMPGERPDLGVHEGQREPGHEGEVGIERGPVAVARHVDDLEVLGAWSLGDRVLDLVVDGDQLASELHARKAPLGREE